MLICVATGSLMVLRVGCLAQSPLSYPHHFERMGKVPPEKEDIFSKRSEKGSKHIEAHNLRREGAPLVSRSASSRTHVDLCVGVKLLVTVHQSFAPMAARGQVTVSSEQRDLSVAFIRRNKAEAD